MSSQEPPSPPTPLPQGEGSSDLLPVRAWRDVVADTGGVTVRVRRLPTTASGQIGTLTTGAAIAILPVVPGDAVSGLAGNEWTPVWLAEGEKAGLKGYVHAALLLMPEEEKRFAWVTVCPAMDGESV